MRYLDDYKIFESILFNGYDHLRSLNDIDSICKQYGIEKYTINDDKSIDVDDDVLLYDCNLTSLPLKFNKVRGTFDCEKNKLTSLEGSPKYVGMAFYCSKNELTSLEGSPEYVGNCFCCEKNELTSLEGSPKYIGGEFDCGENNLTSLEGFPEHVGGFHCENNPIYSIVQYFIRREDKNNLIELFNYYDIVQDMNVIYDRLIYFYEGIDFTFTEYLLKDVRESGYKIIE